MNNLYALMRDQESILDEKFSVGVRWNAGERIRAINDAIVIANRDLKFLIDIGTDYTVANQKFYNLPRTQDGHPLYFEDMQLAIWQPGLAHIILEPKPVEEVARYIPQSTAYPRLYSIHPTQKVLELYPRPNQNASTSTLTSAVGLTDVTLNITTTLGVFPAIGTVLIDSEKITFTNNANNQLTGCVRGAEGTTPSAHLINATVTNMDLQYWYYRRPFPLVRYYNNGTATFTNSSSTVTGNGTVWINNLTANDWIGTGLQTPADPERYYQILSVDANNSMTLKEPYSESTQTNVVYGAGQDTDFPSLYEQGILYLSLYRLFLKDDDPKSQAMYAAYEQFKNDRLADGIPADYLPVSGRKFLRRDWRGNFDFPVSFSG